MNDHDTEIGLVDLVLPIAQRWGSIVLMSLGAGLLALGITFLQTPVFAARTSVLPLQQQNQLNSLLGSLGSLAVLGGSTAALRTPGDQVIAMLQSQRIADTLIDRFDLMKVYEAEFRFQARDQLAANSRIELGRKDGVILIEVEDEDPRRAADMANAYVAELKLLTNTMALTEAQQRRQFFEQEVARARGNLTKAQVELQSSGISVSALRAEPKAAADAISSVRAEVAAAEVGLRMIRRSLVDEAPEVQQFLAKLSALREKLDGIERAQPPDDTNYINKFRNFRYQEALVEAFSRQFELARLDESREGAVVQVIDTATVPEWKTKPKRARTAITVTLGTAFLLIAYFVASHMIRVAARQQHTAAKLAELRQAMRLRRSADLPRR